jgi:hypothetical protein
VQRNWLRLYRQAIADDVEPTFVETIQHLADEHPRDDLLSAWALLA